MDFVEVDGSEGEGGGQILRSAVSFAIVMKKPVRVSRVRAGREVPGLKRQHVSSLKVLAEIFDCNLTGASEGSSEVTLIPGTPRREEFSADMGTAASIPLVLQAVVPAVSLTGSRLSLDLVGGTDVPWSPTFDYLASVVAGGFAAMGVGFSARAARRGYYPKGGGRATAEVQPCLRPKPLMLPEPAHPTAARLVSRCGSLPRHVAERQARAASDILKAGGLEVEEPTVSEEDSYSPGSSILATLAGQGVYVGTDGLGAKGVRAEEVGEDVARRLLVAWRSGARVDANLADMVVPIVSLADGPSKFRTCEATQHLRSSLSLARQFTGCSYDVVGEGSGAVVSLTPAIDSDETRHNV